MMEFPVTLLKKRLRHGCCAANFAKVLGTFFSGHLQAAVSEDFE